MKRNLIVFIFVLVIIAWGTNLFISVKCLDSWDKRGQFGDLFGATNSLFSGLAFAGLIITIVLQRKELSLQRDELRLQREEMAKSREELAKQAKHKSDQIKTIVAELKIRSLEAEISALEMESIGKSPSLRGEEYARKIRAIKKEMDTVIQKLEKKLNS